MQGRACLPGQSVLSISSRSIEVACSKCMVLFVGRKCLVHLSSSLRASRLQPSFARGAVDLLFVLSSNNASDKHVATKHNLSSRFEHALCACRSAVSFRRSTTMVV